MTDPLGLFGFEDLGSWFDQVTTGAYHGLKSGPGVAITSFVVGFGDSITFGLSETIREALAPGSSCQVVKDGFYSAGSIAAMFVPIPGVGLASAAAKTGALAVAGAVTVVVKATPAVVSAAKAAPKALVGRTVLAAKVTSEGRTGSQAVGAARVTRENAGHDLVDVWRTVGADEAADIARSASYRVPPGGEGKYFFPSREQAENLGRIYNDKSWAGPQMLSAGQVSRSVVDRAESINPAGEGLAWFIRSPDISLVCNVRCIGAIK